MEAIENSQCDQSSVNTIDLKVCHQSKRLDILIESFSRHRINDEEDDQGICLSGSSSPTDFSTEDLCPAEDDLFQSVNPLSNELVELIEELVTRNIMALDLRKTSTNKIQETDESKNEFSDDDNTEALDLTASTRKTTLGPPPPLAPLVPSGPSDAIKRLTVVEKDMLRQSYHRLIHFLRLDSPNRQQFTEEYRIMALKKLQSFLFMYLIEVKRKSPAGLKMFQDSFGSDSGIRQFFRVFLGKSEQLTRSSSLPSTHPAGFGADDGGTPQILCRGPGHERQYNRISSINNAPYPLRRTDSGHHPYAGGSTSYGHRGSHLSYQSPYNPPQQGYLHPSSAGWYQNASSYHPLPSQNPPQGYRHPQPPFDNTNGSCSEQQGEVINVESVISLVCKLFPNGDVRGLGPDDYDELYGPLQEHPSSPADYNLMTPSPSGSCRTSQHSGSIPGSPASPWQTATHFGNSLTSPLHYSSSSNSPYSNVMSPPLSSANSSPAPASPSSRSVENQMTRMSLGLVPSQPPPLIPLVNSALSSKQQPAVIAPKPVKQSALPQSVLPPTTFRTAHEEMAASLNPVIKEHSMRQVVKSTIEALTVADHDGDTPLMVACANPAYKNEDLYALLERLKSHPQPNRVFSAVNNRRETALYLAASERRPLVAGYLAETMSALRIPLNQTYEKGNTLIHYLAIWGDEFNEVLRYLVRIRTPDDKVAFDLNARNHTGRSALHETVMLYQSNDPVGEGFIKNIQLLLEYGADAGLSDITSGKTPVHIAVEKRDPFLLELLLSKCPGSANAPMYNDNRPLHSAATLTEVTDNQQLELVNILLKYGADKALRNKANKLPIELVQQDRDRVKAVLQARSRQNYGN